MQTVRSRRSITSEIRKQVSYRTMRHPYFAAHTTPNCLSYVVGSSRDAYFDHHPVKVWNYGPPRPVSALTWTSCFSKPYCYIWNPPGLFPAEGLLNRLQGRDRRNQGITNIQISSSGCRPSRHTIAINPFLHPKP